MGVAWVWEMGLTWWWCHGVGSSNKLSPHILAASLTAWAATNSQSLASHSLYLAS